MNREYKFKAWLKNEKKMVEVDDIRNLLSDTLYTKEICFYNRELNSFNYEDFENIELLPYIGRKDKNNTEIYESYIVKLPAYLTNYTEYAICKWLDNRFSVEDIIGFGFVDLKGKIVRSDEWEDFEVIGNIYENPELLGGKYE